MPASRGSRAGVGYRPAYEAHNRGKQIADTQKKNAQRGGVHTPSSTAAAYIMLHSALPGLRCRPRPGLPAAALAAAPPGACWAGRGPGAVPLPDRDCAPACWAWAAAAAPVPPAQQGWAAAQGCAAPRGWAGTPPAPAAWLASASATTRGSGPGRVAGDSRPAAPCASAARCSSTSKAASSAWLSSRNRSASACGPRPASGSPPPPAALRAGVRRSVHVCERAPPNSAEWHCARVLSQRHRSALHSTRAPQTRHHKPSAGLPSAPQLLQRLARAKAQRRVFAVHADRAQKAASSAAHGPLEAAAERRGSGAAGGGERRAWLLRRRVLLRLRRGRHPCGSPRRRPQLRQRGLLLLQALP